MGKHGRGPPDDPRRLRHRPFDWFVESVPGEIRRRYHHGNPARPLPGKRACWFLPSSTSLPVRASTSPFSIRRLPRTCPTRSRCRISPRVLGAYHEPVEGKPTYRLGGMTCLAGDHMGDYSFDRPLNVGDRIVFDDMIHYTMVKTHDLQRRQPARHRHGSNRRYVQTHPRIRLREFSRTG